MKKLINIIVLSLIFSISACSHVTSGYVGTSAEEFEAQEIENAKNPGRYDYINQNDYCIELHSENELYELFTTSSCDSYSKREYLKRSYGLFVTCYRRSISKDPKEQDKFYYRC